MGFLKFLLKKFSSQPKRGKIYVCFDRTDKEVANSLCTAFRNSNAGCYLKTHDVVSKDYDKIFKRIDKSDAFVVILSASCINSEFALVEVQRAFESEVPIFVFKIEDVGFGNMEFYLKGRTVIDDVDRLVWEVFN